ncbi:MAG: hypothetical protein K5662_03625 [Lachnospiraceae bacterium]|nr:hypothetical protein [Lachnospiraceae bacterium]
MSVNMIIKTGLPYPLGSTVVSDDMINFAVVIGDAKKCGVILYNKSNHRETRITFKPNNRIGNIYCILVSGIGYTDYEYSYFRDDEVFCDPYSKRIIGNDKWGKTPRTLRGGLVKTNDFKRKCPDMLKYSDSYFYLLHVRGFTRHPSSGVKAPGTYSGVVEKLPYLEELGITTIEIMPSYEFIEFEDKRKKNNEEVIDPYGELAPKLNYWGYKKGYYFAPKASYATPGKNPVEEFHAMVEAIHDRGMEIIMQFYFPRDVKQAMILEALKYWVVEYQIDGFHLCGDNIMLSLLGTEPLLANTKLLYNGVPVNEIYGNSRPTYKNLAVCNDDYMYNIRRFLKSDEGQLESVIMNMRWIDERIAGVHYITGSNGFTLMDLVSFDRKHNEENGENDRDGNPYNASWNCGVEGSTRRKTVNRLRRKQIRNAIVFNMFTESTPMMLAGDEFGNSQKGNNNPYCLDNNVTWLNWKDIDRNSDILSFTRQCIAFRKEHGILHMDKSLKMSDYESKGVPDLSYHGEECWRIEGDMLTRHFAMLFAEDYSSDTVKRKVAFIGRKSDNKSISLQEEPTGEEAAVKSKKDKEKVGPLMYVAVNMHWCEHEFALPFYNRCKWFKVIDTEKEEFVREQVKEDSRTVTVKERSIVVFLNYQS